MREQPLGKNFAPLGVPRHSTHPGAGPGPGAVPAGNHPRAEAAGLRRFRFTGR
ncbi:hypothetical protein ACF068_24570 [Streptomyces sp. NPDC016309]|uniref:hypothetical protein n=1 Tax=Streptomyces sp. NPDC016309 TaxID=3364965 RepID=UPI0036FD779F